MPFYRIVLIFVAVLAIVAGLFATVDWPEVPPVALELVVVNAKPLGVTAVYSYSVVSPCGVVVLVVIYNDGSHVLYDGRNIAPQEVVDEIYNLQATFIYVPCADSDDSGAYKIQPLDHVI